LVLSGTQITGTPTAASSSPFILRVSDSAGDVAYSQPLTIAVAGPLSITTTSLPSGVVNTAYSTTLAATGGNGSNTWSVSPGGLPPGLTLNASSGAITGTPTQSGVWTFTVQVSDTAGHTASSRALTINVVAGLTITTTSLPNGTVGVAYSQQLAAIGGATPYSWSVQTGSLPPNLALVASTGVLSGTPTSAGAFSFVARVTDHAGTGASSSTLSFTIAAPPLSVSCSASPNPVSVGAQTTYTAVPTGGTPSYSYVWTGCTVSPTTPTLCTFTPSSTGTYSATVQVTDSQNAATSNSCSVSAQATSTMKEYIRVGDRVIAIENH
jgi:hypothetical protein